MNPERNVQLRYRTGAPGIRGLPGVDGVLPVGTTGTTGTQGPVGASPVGPTGATGPQGVQGETLFMSPEMRGESIVVIEVGASETKNGIIQIPSGCYITSIESDSECWFRLYDNPDHRADDNTRTRLVDPPIDSGIILDRVFTGPENFEISPVISSFYLWDDVISSEYNFAITNDGASGEITITIRWYTIEEIEYEWAYPSSNSGCNIHIYPYSKFYGSRVSFEWVDSSVTVLSKDRSVEITATFPDPQLDVVDPIDPDFEFINEHSYAVTKALDGTDGTLITMYRIRLYGDYSNGLGSPPLSVEEYEQVLCFISTTDNAWQIVTIPPSYALVISQANGNFNTWPDYVNGITLDTWEPPVSLQCISNCFVLSESFGFTESQLTVPPGG